MNANPTIASLIQAFFLDFLVAQRSLSANTVSAYRDGIKLFLNFAARQRARPVDQLHLEDFDARLVLAFLEDRQRSQGNCTRTRNARLAALHALFRYVGGQQPQALARCQQIAQVPVKKTSHRQMEYLEDAEMRALLRSVDRRAREGPRDHALLLLLYNTGARVQELVDLKTDHLRLQTPFQARLLGKGQKQRTCPLWPETVAALKSYLDHRQPSTQDCPVVFLNTNGQPITRFGIRYLVRQYGIKAAQNCPSLKAKKLSPHTLRRHTTAMHLLQSGIDLSVIKDWLGHVDLNTTHGYVAIDMKMKRKALDATPPPPATSTRKPQPQWFKPSILKWLEDLSKGA